MDTLDKKASIFVRGIDWFWYAPLCFGRFAHVIETLSIIQGELLKQVQARFFTDVLTDSE